MSSKNPWETFPQIWNTKAKFMAFIRGGIRKGLWNRHPIKLEFIKKHRKRVLNEKTGNEVWGGECEYCGKDFLQKDLQVDHLQGNTPLRSMDDLENFVDAMLFVDFDDLVFSCKPCHAIKTHSERKGITFEQARIEKLVIEILKDKKYTNEILDDHGLKHTNDKVRKEGIKQLIEEGRI